jgi:branched-chain amino acid transport system ATP-binding protein
MALLEIDAVSKAFGSLKAVDQVSFDVGAGEIFGVAGPNGSGKSTLFNIITGIPFGPDAGRVRLDGMEIQGKTDAIARLGLGRTFQRETSFDELTIFENAGIGANSASRANPPPRCANRPPKRSNSSASSAPISAGSPASFPSTTASA